MIVEKEQTASAHPTGDTQLAYAPPPRHDVLGVGISVINPQSAIEHIDLALAAKEKGYVCVTGVHGVIVSRDCDQFRDILNGSLLTTPDGMPMVWMGKWNRFPEIDRVYGPDLMLAVCEQGLKTGRRHFLYGGGEGVAERLAERLCEKLPGVEIVGTYTPPFRPLNEQEQQDLAQRVAQAKPDCFWVGLSTPKQERFMAEYLPRLDTTLMFGVGAAFDFHAGLVSQAPRWMQRSGMEWLFRLCMEPRRLWKRYLVNNSRFVTLAGRQLMKGRPHRQQLAAERRFDSPAASSTEPRVRGLSVIVPMYNEAECVPGLVDTLLSIEKDLADRFRFEFVLVDDASRDNTVELVGKELAGRDNFKIVRHNENQGIAAAIHTGLAAGSEDLAASIDADCSYDPGIIAELAPLIDGETVMATASPYHPDGEVLNLPAWRIKISKAASRLYRAVSPQALTCYTCCVRAYNRRAVLECEPKNGGFVGVAELAWQVQRSGGRIAEVPAVLRPRTAGASKMRTLSATFDHLKLISRIALSRLIPAKQNRPTTTPLTQTEN